VLFYRQPPLKKLAFFPAQALINSGTLMTESIPRNISLNEVGLRYMNALQRLGDLAVLSWAGAQAADGPAYERLFQSIPGLPATEAHLPFPAAREEAERWELKHSANEVMGLTMVFLEEVRRHCAVIAFNAARATASGDLTALAAEINTPPPLADLEARLRQLRERYGASSPLEGELVSLAGFATALFQTHGVVPENQPPLTLRLKMIRPSRPRPAAAESEPRVVFFDFAQVWSTGEKIALTREQHAGIFTTVSLFISSLLASVRDFASRSGLPVNSPPQKGHDE